MRINLISNLGEDAKIGDLYNFNMVVAWNLRKAFMKRGVEAQFVRDRTIRKTAPPTADHSIVISAGAMRAIKGQNKQPGYYEKIRDNTTGKLTMYLDSDYGGWKPYFDHIFTVVVPQNNKNFIYGGWGADPEFFYPDQQERAVFVDSLMHNFYKGRYNKIYDILKEVFKIPDHNLETGDPLTQTIPSLDMTLHMPIPGYNKRFKTIYWPEIQGIIRKCHYYCCTQWGESGLTRIESATSGALLVIPEELYRPRTMASLEHRIWRTKDELIDILMTKTDPKAISEKALEHSWDKVADRMLKVFEGKSG